MIPEDRLLTPEEISDAFGKPSALLEHWGDFDASLKSIAQAQDAKTRRETAREIFEEIEKEFFAEPQYISEHGKEPVLGCLDEITWQALKAQYEGVNK